MSNAQECWLCCADLRIHPRRRPPTRHDHVDTPTPVGTGSSHCHGLKNLTNYGCAIVEMAESGPKLSGSFAVATIIDRGERCDDGASKEKELGSTDGGGVGERFEVRSCGRRPCSANKSIIAISAALNLHLCLSTVTLLLLCLFSKMIVLESYYHPHTRYMVPACYLRIAAHYEGLGTGSCVLPVF